MFRVQSNAPPFAQRSSGPGPSFFCAGVPRKNIATTGRACAWDEGKLLATVDGAPMSNAQLGQYFALSGSVAGVAGEAYDTKTPRVVEFHDVRSALVASMSFSRYVRTDILGHRRCMTGLH